MCMRDDLSTDFNEYQEELYQQWREDPDLVAPEWRSFFENINVRDLSRLSEQGPEPGLASASDSFKQSRVSSLVRAYRDVGYIYADLNPLGKYRTPEMKYQYITMQGAFQSLELSSFNLSDEDLGREFYTGDLNKDYTDSLSNILARMKKIYCSHIGYEFQHIQNTPMRNWLIRNIEDHEMEVSDEYKIRLQKDLIKAEEFEHFIQTHFIGQKRFSVEGGEAVIPAIHYLIISTVKHNIQEVTLGMAHRGRLNVLTNALRKPAQEIFAMFLHQYKPHEYGGSGDVKYHLGQNFDFTDHETGKKVHISLVPNPSHLESVDPVVEGKTRGVQRRRGDDNRKKVIPILIHGESAFTGQGVVAETFNLSQLRGYRTGGTIHIIQNNQIGFTTASRDQRSSYFATELAKTVGAPIFHVHGDDPESVIKVIDLALRWRQKFGYDVVVDIICYRRLGHNEADEPSFTHPIMYSLIEKHPSVRRIYGDKLIAEGIFSQEEQDSFKEKYIQVLRDQKQLAAEKKIEFNDSYKQGKWSKYVTKYHLDTIDTTIDKDRLYHIARRLTFVPEDFSLHPKLKKFVENRVQMIDSGQGVDWAFAEALSLGSLLMEGYSVRFSGEDCARGTFSQRHSRWWDVHSGEPKNYVPLKHLDEKQAFISIYDSPLSEFSVLGFEYGYSLTDPECMVIWEAQFGDFANGAQVMIDQFIAAGESKWFRSSGLIMLLPHGFEGQGPEHSSGHLERYLQLCADNNWQVCNASTPAQYYHLLRKQMKQPFRKPLILMTPKSLLRNNLAVSPMEDLYTGQFHMILNDPEPPAAPDTLILCSGKVYYDLYLRRQELKDESTAILRLEQLYPFPAQHLKNMFATYKNIKRFLWVQEEPRNRGAWFYIDQMLRQDMGISFEYIGRDASASPATGSFKEHEEELELILQTAFPGKAGKDDVKTMKKKGQV